MKNIRKLILTIMLITAFFFVSCTTTKAETGVIGIAWRSDPDSEFYTNITKTLDDLDIPYVMVDQVVSYSIPYENNKVAPSAIDENDILISEYAEAIKSELYTNSNIDAVMSKHDCRAVIFTGGEDIAPTLLASPEPWHGIEDEKDYNATRDVSDYLLMTYCIDNDIPVIGFCRGAQMLGVVSGADIIQDLPVYFEEQGVPYSHEHRNEKATPDSYRDYAPHDVTLADGSKVKELFQKDVLENIPSWHHQALTGLEGTPLILAGYTDVNGLETVEIIERTDRDFVIGFQFHPEASYVKHLENASNADDFIDMETASIIFREIGKLAK
ncbi:MAG: gamma-glutamyl-gamma-aminobutyrate hydrolase family protein [Bullifex sp.]